MGDVDRERARGSGREPARDFDREPAAGQPWLRLAIGAAALIALIVLARWAGSEIPRFTAWVGSLGPLAPLVFGAAYAVAVVAFVPASVLTLAAGAIFGLWSGVAIVFVAASVGACLAFALARSVARGAVERRISTLPRFAAIDRAIARDGRRIVFLLRLSPVFPFGLLNYALGMTRVRFADYALACIGMLPGTLLYVYTGQAIGLVAAAAGGAGRTRSPTEWALYALGLVATVVVTVLVTRIARRALAEATS